jgi:hypothetical protein
MSLRATLCLLATLLPLAGPAPVLGQVPFETRGTRALGMGGAFVAVADDSSATYWNPAGLSTIRFFDATLERTDVDHDDLVPGREGTGTGWMTGVTRFAVAVPVLAFSYDRLSMADVRGVATAELAPDRQDPRAESVARTFRVQHFGLTLVQSLGDFIVVGSTLRVVRAGVEAVPLEAGTPVDEGLRRGEGLDVRSEGRFDADIGALAWIGRLRLGLVVRNLSAPEFDVADGEPWRLERQARIGVAAGGEPARGQRPWVMALDADLTTTPLPEGDRRSLAAGGERWWSDRHVGLRAGARVQTVGDLRPAASGGVSVAIRSGLLIEAQATGGVDEADQGWSVAARLTF